jgi:hypothetical protein
VSCRIIFSETVTRTGNGVGIVAGMKRGAIGVRDGSMRGEASLMLPHKSSYPAKAGIQYAAAFRFRHGRVARSSSKLPRVQLSNSLLLRRHSFAVSPRIHASFAINVLPT